MTNLAEILYVNVVVSTFQQQYIRMKGKGDKRKINPVWYSIQPSGKIDIFQVFRMRSNWLLVSSWCLVQHYWLEESSEPGGDPCKSTENIQNMTRVAARLWNPPSHSLFTLSDNRYTSVCCCTTTLLISFIPQTVRLLNSSPTLQLESSFSCVV